MNSILYKLIFKVNQSENYGHTVHNCYIVSVHFDKINCTEICDKLRRQLSMLTYIYFNVDECLTSAMPKHISLSYAQI